MRRSWTSHSEVVAGYVFLVPLILIIALFSFYPIAHSVFLSLHRIVLSLPGLGEHFVGFANYAEFFKDPVARNSLCVTFAFVGISTALELILGLFIALIINEAFRGRGMVRAVVLVPWAIPTVIASQMWRFAFNDQYGIVNLILFGSQVGRYEAWLASPTWALGAVILADVWKTSSFAALLILAGLQTIPDELYEAAKIDGANSVQRFFSITLPLVKPAILIALIFRTMDSFRIFDLVFVMTQGGPGDATSVLQFYGYKKMFAEGMIGFGSTVSIVVFAIVFLVSIGYLKMIGTSLLQRRRAE